MSHTAEDSRIPSEFHKISKNPRQEIIYSTIKMFRVKEEKEAKQAKEEKELMKERQKERKKGRQNERRNEQKNTMKSRNNSAISL